MVGVGDGGSDGVTGDLRVVKLQLAAIGTRDENAAGRVQEAAAKSSLAELEIARVLMQDRGKNGAGHQRADAGVRVKSGEALVIAGKTLAVGGIAVARLTK